MPAYLYTMPECLVCIRSKYEWQKASSRRNDIIRYYWRNNFPFVFSSLGFFISYSIAYFVIFLLSSFQFRNQSHWNYITRINIIVPCNSHSNKSKKKEKKQKKNMNSCCIKSVVLILKFNRIINKLTNHFQKNYITVMQESVR